MAWTADVRSWKLINRFTCKDLLFIEEKFWYREHKKTVQGHRKLPIVLD
jgi:hypothetical protein